MHGPVLRLNCLLLFCWSFVTMIYHERRNDQCRCIGATRRATSTFLSSWWHMRFAKPSEGQKLGEIGIAPGFRYVCGSQWIINTTGVAWAWWALRILLTSQHHVWRSHHEHSEKRAYDWLNQVSGQRTWRQSVVSTARWVLWNLCHTFQHLPIIGPCKPSSSWHPSTSQGVRSIPTHAMSIWFHQCNDMQRRLAFWLPRYNRQQVCARSNVFSQKERPTREYMKSHVRSFGLHQRCICLERFSVLFSHSRAKTWQVLRHVPMWRAKVWSHFLNK